MTTAIVHNHPIPYKHLLFQALGEKGLRFQVLYLASASTLRNEAPLLSGATYKFTIAIDQPFEGAPLRRSITAVWRELAKMNPAIVVIGGYHAAGFWAAWAWARSHNRPIIFWYESNEFDYPRLWLKELPKKLFLRHCDRAHVYGITNKAYLVKLGMSESSVSIKRAVADVDKFLPFGNKPRTYSPPESRKLLYVGRLAPEKNVGGLLKSLALANRKLDGRQLSLTIVGTGPLESKLKQLCGELGLNRLVSFKGYCPQFELPPVYSSADFFVLPSTREPWGLVSLEAMLCRVPVIVSTQCGCARDVVNQETGWTFEPWEPEVLADVLVQLPELTNDRLCQMGSAALSLASDYSPHACADRVINSLSELCAKRGLPQPTLEYAV